MNIGLSLARGTYYAAHDDDDLAFPNYVAAFRKGAMAYPGKVLYSYVCMQAWDEHDGVPVAVGAMSYAYCKPVSSASLYHGNSCPNLGCAFPIEVFARNGLSYDEALDVLEDWDFLLRAQMLCGFACLPQPSSLYRLWSQGETSHALHDMCAWRESREYIWRKLDAGHVFLPKDGFRSLLTQSGIERSAIVEQAEVFLDVGQGFSSGMKGVPRRMGDCDGTVSFEFDLRPAGNLPLHALRFDPCHFGGVFVGECRILLFGEGRCLTELDSSACSHNGISIDDGIVFFEDDPQIILMFDDPIAADRAIVTYRFDEQLSGAVAMQAIDACAEARLAKREASQPFLRRVLGGRA